jgi:putative PEP-CTERM system TPR-repeat lipoprotein
MYRPIPSSSVFRSNLSRALAALVALQWSVATLAVTIDPFPSISPGGFAQPPSESANVAALIRRNEFDKALSLTNEMVKANPGAPAPYNLQGNVYLGKKDRANARKSFERAISVDARDPNAHISLGQMDIQDKKAPAARKHFETVLANDPKNVAAHLGMAQLEYLKGADEQALAWFEKAKVARPDAVEPRLNIAAYHVRRHNAAAAIAELTDALTVNPRSADLLDYLGQVQLAAGQPAAAKKTFVELVAARPDAPLAYYRLASAQAAGNDLPAASESLRKALSISPTYADASLALAEIEARSKRYPDAIKYARQAQASQPSSAAGFIVEGDIWASQDKFPDAIAAYKKAAAVRPSGTVAIKLHAVQVRAGDRSQADAGLQKWMSDHPADVGALQYSAADRMRRADAKGAIEQYQRVLKLQPKNVLALNNLANLYRQTGDSRALPTAEAAFAISPQSPVVGDTLGWILTEQATRIAGLACWRRRPARRRASRRFGSIWRRREPRRVRTARRARSWKACWRPARHSLSATRLGRCWLGCQRNEWRPQQSGEPWFHRRNFLRGCPLVRRSVYLLPPGDRARGAPFERMTGCRLSTGLTTARSTSSSAASVF